MSNPAEQFGEAVARLRNVEGSERGPYIHEYVGELVETGEPVRIHTLAPELADEDAVDAFTRVSDQWDNASANANIVPILDRDTDPRPWLAVPDTGEPLASIGTELPPEAVETVITETADALRTLGLYNTVHGHLTPDDIRVSDVADDEPTVEVGGFGLEQAVRAAVGESEPTPYTAPELLDDPTRATERTDVYGLGAVTYFALTGRPPVDGDDLDRAVRDGPPVPPSEYGDAVPPALDEVVMRALSADPGDREETPYAFDRAFRSAFDPDAFETATDAAGDGSEDRDSESASEAESIDDDGGSEGRDSGSASEPASIDDDGGSESRDSGSASEPASSDGGVTRRALTGAVGLTAIGAVAGGILYLDGQSGADEQTAGGGEPEPTSETTESAPATERPAVGDYLDGVDNYDGTVVDARGQETVTVEVGVEANGGPFGFGPPAVHVDNGTTVLWEWTGEGGGHTVTSSGDGPLDSGETVSEAGATYEHTFEEDGIYEYRCLPHGELGMRGAVVVGDDYPTAPSEEAAATGPEFDGYLDGVSNYDGTVVDARGQGTVTVEVGVEANGGAFGFGPPAVHVDNGTTVLWEWTGEGGGHNVVAEDGAFESGPADTEPGVRFLHTFSEDGIYLYYCVPHEGQGMNGAIVVGTDYPRR